MRSSSRSLDVDLRFPWKPFQEHTGIISRRCYQETLSIKPLVGTLEESFVLVRFAQFLSLLLPLKLILYFRQKILLLLCTMQKSINNEEENDATLFVTW